MGGVEGRMEEQLEGMNFPHLIYCYVFLFNANYEQPQK